MRLRRGSRFFLPVLAALLIGCAGTMLGAFIAKRDAIGAAADDYPCPRHKISEISDNADPHERHWVYILNVCGVPHAYRDRAAQGGFDFVEIPMPADAGPPPLVLPKRAAEDESEDDAAPGPPDGGVGDASDAAGR